MFERITSLKAGAPFLFVQRSINRLHDCSGGSPACLWGRNACSDAGSY